MTILIVLIVFFAMVKLVLNVNIFNMFFISQAVQIALGGITFILQILLFTLTPAFWGIVFFLAILAAYLK